MAGLLEHALNLWFILRVDEIDITYRFMLGNDRVEEFELRLDPETLELKDGHQGDYPEWTELQFHQCPHCPLKKEDHKHCPAALQLADATLCFDDIISYAEVELEVITVERRITQRTTAQRAISSLLGLLFATSGCPYTDFMKPMARFHLPLSSPEETIFRVTGMYRLSQYLLHKEGRSDDPEFKGLTEIYDDLHTVNTMIAERVRFSSQADSSVNAVILLDMFTNLVPYVVDENLTAIAPYFGAYMDGPSA